MIVKQCCFYHFNLEIYLRFNLEPLHLLQQFAKEIARKRDRQYFRSYVPKNAQLSVSTSGAIHSYWKNEERRAKLPLDIWK